MKEKRKKIQSRLGFLSPILFFMVLVCLDFAFRRLCCPLEWRNKDAWLFTLGWAALLTAIAFLLPRRGGRVFMGVTGGLFGILVLVHAALRNLFGDFFSVADLLYSGEGAAFFSLSYVQIRKALVICVLLYFLGIGACIWLYPKNRKKKLRYWAGGAVLLLSVGLITGLHMNLMHRSTEQSITWDILYTEVDHSDAYQSYRSPNTAMITSGIYQYTLRDILVSSGLSGGRKDQEQVEELDAYFAERREELCEDNEMSGIFAGKNVMFIMMESIDTWLLNEDYMPNLWALQQESINFTNFYTPLYLKAGTFCTEFVTQAGIIPPAKGISTDVYTQDSFPYALPQLFEKEGYAVNSFHGSEGDVYNRGEIHRNLGFSTYYGGKSMGMENYFADTQMSGGFEAMTAREPFMDFIITISAHGPYTGGTFDREEEAAAAIASRGVTSSEENMAEYSVVVAKAMETDAFVGELMDYLREEGLLEDTVLVFYTDHYGKYMSDTDFIMELKDIDNRTELLNTPFFIYSQGTEPMEVEKYMGTLDFAPTMANLFDLPVDRRNYLGHDVFSREGGYVILPDGGWYDGETLCDSSFQGTLTEELSQRSAQALRELTLSGYILSCDYYRDLGEK